MDMRLYYSEVVCKLVRGMMYKHEVAFSCEPPWRRSQEFRRNTSRACGFQGVSCRFPMVDCMHTVAANPLLSFVVSLFVPRWRNYSRARHQGVYHVL